MNSGLLNEHDAHRGAESRGEFFGMTGNSAWYLFGSSGASVLLVIVLWGMLGLSLLMCLVTGLILCGLSVAYVFALKNNKPAHYDTDFFESALVEAGVVPLAFGPRATRPVNPFRATSIAVEAVEREAKATAPASTRRGSALVKSDEVSRAAEPVTVTRAGAVRTTRRMEEVPVVPLVAYERLQSELNTATDLLEDVLAEREEELT